MDIKSLNLQPSDVRFLLIVSAFVEKIGVVEEINRLCPSEKEVSPEHLIMAHILDALSGMISAFLLRLHPVLTEYQRIIKEAGRLLCPFK